MPKKKYLVTLTDEERAQLEQMIRRGKTAARKVTRAHILLRAADGWGDAEIGPALNVGRATVERLRQRFLAEGLDVQGQARLIAEACSPAPDGHECWTLQLLADRMVALGLAEACSYETVRRVLKKTRSSRGARSSGWSRSAIRRPT